MDDIAGTVYYPLLGPLTPFFGSWCACRSRAEAAGRASFRIAQPAIQSALSAIDSGNYSRATASARPRYRFLAWNLERGAQFEGQVHALRTHPYLRACDVLLLSEADLGMARSQNRAVARALARELGMHYAFAPCYLNLTKGAGAERELPGENQLGLQGNAILSRYPLGDVRRVELRNGADLLAGREKRLGSEAALAATIQFPNLAVRTVSVHLAAHSSQRHRRDQMFDVLEQLSRDHPVVLGGDWNTTTYNSSGGLRASLSIWRPLLGMDNLILNHHLQPYRRFEKLLFRLLEERGFDYRRSNRLDEPTACYDVANARALRSLGDWVPAWCFACIRWALRHHGGRSPLKLDWFATRGVVCRDPIVLHDLREGRAVPLSDHDPIGLDVLV